MKDGIIKGTGDSRYLKGAGWPSTYAEFKAMAEAGKLPFDLAGINAAGWQQIGDALNKANLLSDATAAKLDGVATPNAAFDLLSRFHAGLGNEYVWAKEQHSYIEKRTVDNVTLTDNGSTTYTIYYSSSILINQSTGAVSLVNPSSISGKPSTINSTINGTGFLNNKYIQSTYISNKIYFVPAGYIVEFINGRSVRIGGGGYVTSTLSITLINYVNSKFSDTYPPAVSDGYTYTALGKIGEKARIATGSYVGTETFGSGNSNSLTFDFVPQCVLIQAETSSQFSTAYTLLWCGQSGDATYGLFSLLNKTLSWYGNSAANQKNTSGTTYKYVAFG